MYKIFLTVLLGVLLSGCAHRQGVPEGSIEARGAELHDLSKSRIVSVVNEPYLGARPVLLGKNSEFSSGVFARHITLNRQGGLADICATVSRLTGVPITVDAAVRPSGQGSGGGATLKDSELDAQLAAALGVDGQTAREKPAEKPAVFRNPRGGVRIAYEGTVKGLLDHIGSRFNLAWEYSNGGVVFAATAVRTFTIWAAPGQVSYSNTITNASGGSGGSGGAAGGNGGAAGSEMANETAQTNAAECTIDVWKDVEESVKKLLSPAGTVMSNQAAGTVTVKDTAASLNRIEKFIDQTNESLSRQIALSIKVWSLEIADTADIGLSLSMFFENPDVRVFAGSSPVRFSKLGGELSAAIVDGGLRESAALLKALRSVGRATQVISGGGVVMSNQPVPVQAVKREAYLASSSLTTTDAGETSSLTPGEVTTGFAMTVIPHIMEGRRVVLQYTINLSSLDDLAEFSSGDATIQLPKVSTRSFAQRMTIKMGQTLVLAGFEQEIAGKDTSGGLLGLGRSERYTKSLMVITITTESGDV